MTKKHKQKLNNLYYFEFHLQQNRTQQTTLSHLTKAQLRFFNKLTVFILRAQIFLPFQQKQGI